MNPRLRPNLIVRKLASRDEAYVIVKDPAQREYFKFEDWEYDLLVLLDGSRDPGEVAAEFGKKHPDRDPDVQFVLDYVEDLRGLDLVERGEQERHLIMMEHLRSLRKRRLFYAHSLFLIDVPLFDPDKLLNRFIPWIGWLWSPWFVASWLVVFVIVLGQISRHWHLYWSGFFSLWNPSQKGPLDWVGLFALLAGVSVWHELGHAFTCKRYGGEVHDIGFIVFYLTPAFYCRTDDSYLFPRLSHRIYTTFGGAYFELMICCLAAAVWSLTPAEWWIHGVALTVVFLTGLSAVVLNVNPLIRLDGYYVLMDWLDVPRLREDSFDYIGERLKKRLLHLEVPVRAISRRRRRIYLIYGLSSIIYTTCLILLLYGFLRRWLLGWIGPAGYLILFAAIGWFFHRKIAGAFRFLRHLWLDKRDVLRSRRGALAAGAVLLLLTVLLAVPRSTTRIEGRFTVTPGEKTLVRAPAEGIVRSVDVIEGSKVRPGQILGVLQNPDLETDLVGAASRLARAVRESAAAREQEPVFVLERAAEAGGARASLDQARSRIQTLSLHAPTCGIVSTRDLESLVGRFLREGDVFCEVDRLDTVKLALAVPESLIEEVLPGTPIRLFATAYPGRTFRATLLSLAPVAQPPASKEETTLDPIRRVHLVRATIEVDNPEELLFPGMTGRLQFLTSPMTPGGKLWHGVRRWAASLIW